MYIFHVLVSNKKVNTYVYIYSFFPGKQKLIKIYQWIGGAHKIKATLHDFML